MAYIYYNKELDQYRLFGSLPVMCSSCGLDNKKLEYQFSRLRKSEFETESFKIVKVKLERGGKKQN